MKTPVAALIIGTVVTLVLFGLGYIAADATAMTLSYALYWQAWVLYQLLPCTDIRPVCESQTAAMVTFYAGIPLGIIVYSLAAWGVLSWRRRRGQAPA